MHDMSGFRVGLGVGSGEIGPLSSHKPGQAHGDDKIKSCMLKRRNLVIHENLLTRISNYKKEFVTPIFIRKAKKIFFIIHELLELSYFIKWKIEALTTLHIPQCAIGFTINCKKNRKTCYVFSDDKFSNEFKGVLINVGFADKKHT